MKYVREKKEHKTGKSNEKKRTRIHLNSTVSPITINVSELSIP